ncbi:MAG: hypothetical protein K2Z80_34860 [Xanthobacteraceae bacterium]|nr:hypothetical protein [Xanthobacteraceae bacterium]
MAVAAVMTVVMPMAMTMTTSMTTTMTMPAAVSTMMMLRPGVRGRRREEQAGHRQCAGGIDREKRSCRQHARQVLPHNAARVVGRHIFYLQFRFAEAKLFQLKSCATRGTLWHL